MHLLTATTPDLSGLSEFFRSLTLGKLIPTLLILAVGIVVIRLLMKLFDRALQRTKLEPASFGMIKSIMRAVLYFILILIAVSGLGVDVTSLIAVLSIVSLALSLAVQGALSNVVGGFTLLSTHPFKAGDYVEIGSRSGVVHEVGLVYTKLTTLDNKIISIPNSIASGAEIVNYSTAENRRVDIQVSAAYSAPTEDVKAALLRAANVPTALFTPEPFAGLESYGESAINYVVRVWTPSDTYWDTFFQVTENIREEFAQAGITMTFPHLNVHLEQ